MIGASSPPPASAVRPRVLFFKLLAIIIVVEITVMLALGALPEMPRLTETLIDASLLTLIAAPLLWMVVATPLRAAVEAERSRAEAGLEGVLVGSIDAIVTVDRERRIVIFSKGAEELFGWRAAEILGKPLDLLIPTRLVDAHRDHVEGFESSSLSHKAMEHRGVVPARRKDGSEVRVEASLSKVDRDGHLYMTAIIREVTAREAADAALRDALLQAEQAARAKSEFLAAMSHELRTPLNAILGMSEALQEEVYGPLNDPQRSSIREVEEAGSHLLSLINDILDLSKIEVGKRPLELEAAPVAELVDSCVRMVRDNAGRRSIALRTELGDAPELLRTDVRALKQVLMNLLSNAVKFTPEHGAVSVRLSREGGADGEMLRIAVQDSGIGIAAEDLPRLFRPFEQLESGLARRFEGTGLGLALSAKLVQQLGGRIEVASEPGKGSVFAVTVPIDRG